MRFLTLFLYDYRLRFSDVNKFLQEVFIIRGFEVRKGMPKWIVEITYIAFFEKSITFASGNLDKK